MTTPLFDRAWRLRVAPVVQTTAGLPPEGGLDLSELDIEFNVRKSLKPGKPNTCDLRLWGLEKQTQLVLQSAKALQVVLEAGYVGSTELIFSGQVRHSYTRRTGAAHETYLETGSSEKDMAAAGIKATYNTSLTVQEAFKEIGATLAVDFPGLDTSVAATLGMFNPLGGTIHRSTARILDDICLSANLEWTIQDGVLQILQKNQPNRKQQTLISEDSGMIGSPSINHKGEMVVTSLIVPGVNPGSPVRVEGESIKDNFRVESVHYQGDTSPGGNRPWYAKITGSSV